MPPNNNPVRAAERGNVFIFILLGLVLFAALSFTVSRGFRSDTTSQMTARQAELAASDILNYAQQLERAVNRLRRLGCSENQLSFQFDSDGDGDFNDSDEALHNTNAPTDFSCHIFHGEGGNIDHSEHIAKMGTSSTESYATGSTGMVGIGEDDRSDLYFRLRLGRESSDFNICYAINNKLGVEKTGTAPADAFDPIINGGWTATTFTGSFDNAATPLSSAVNGIHTYCAGHNTDLVSFYHVLLAR